jgi:ABC-type nitrate/sulfonate/bicarbonate transport system permease component
MISPKARERLLGVTLVVLWLLLWELFIQVGWVDPRFFRAPSAIVSRFFVMMVSDDLGLHLSVSLQRLVVGYLLGVIPALIVGWTLSRRRWLNAGCGPLLVIFGAFPAMALFPIIMLIFGLGEWSKGVVVAVSVFFPVLYCTRISAARVQDDSRGVVATLDTVGPADHPGPVRRGALRLIFVGLKLAAATGLLTPVAAEFVGAKTGIGLVIWQSWMSFGVESIYVGIALAGLVGSLTWLVLNALEWRVLSMLARNPALGGVLE